MSSTTEATLKHAIRFDFKSLKTQVPEAFSKLQKIEVFSSLDQCNEFRWVVKAACYLYEEADLKDQIHKRAL